MLEEEAKSNFLCPFCRKTFTRKSNLSRHTELHTNTERYACSICQQAFLRKSNLKRHITKMHPPEIRFKCKRCDCTFTRRSNLKRHELSQHDVHERQKNICNSKTLSAFSWYVNDTEWEDKLRRLYTVKKPRITWPKSKKVSWDTLPYLIEKLDSWGIIPPQLKTGYVNPLNPLEPFVDPWDPCYFNGKVKGYWDKVNVSVRHVQKDFWKIWPAYTNRRTVILTNPPFLQKWLEPFFHFLSILDHPFVLILSHNMCNRLYLGEYLYDRIERPEELHIFSLQRSFRMEQKGGHVTGMAGLILCTYYPKEWNFKLNENIFGRVIPVKCLHG